MTGYDVALLGGGGAAHLVLLALADRGLPLRVAVVDPVVRSGWDRTWCFWGAGPTLVDEVVEGSWRRLRLAGGGLADQVVDLEPLRYRLVRSGPVYDLARRRVAGVPGLTVEHVPAGATRVLATARGPLVETDAGALTATWVLDSRPGPPTRPAGVTWVQSFLGWVLPPGSGPDLAATPVLMDFRTRPPGRGLSFGYALPLGDGSTLVEYTEFGPRPLDPVAAEPVLREYLDLLGTTCGAVPDHVETGAIPMTDAPFPRRGAVAGTWRIGTAGGATRGSTGYTFAAMHRQALAIADLLARGRPPEPPPAYPARHRAMDAALLHALDLGLVDGPAFFRRLFDRLPAQLVLRYLDGLTRPDEELAVMAAAPRAAMVRAGLAALVGR